MSPRLAAAERVDVFLQPGEFFVGDQACRIHTVLGSCVSVTLSWAPRRVGAMSHFMMASRAAAGGGHGGLDGRYCEDALQLMWGELERRKVPLSECQAKLFGGGDMFAARHTGELPAIGRRNGEAARALLRERGIEVVSESLFGQGYRQVVFDVASGHVWSRQVPPDRPG